MNQLLFFDTFSHDSGGSGGGGELNLDLVQFPSPVYVSEVRVIPLGAKVKANFPGGVRLGATNPNKFELEFFVNNLRAPGASTFESIGLLQYNQTGSIALHISEVVATDGLVLRGHYSTITLAVYGVVSDSTPDQLARQAAAVQPAEPELPRLAVDTAGRSLGETYAAQWTEKHSQQPGAFQPPDGWAELEKPVEKKNGRSEEAGGYQERVKENSVSEREGRLSIEREPDLSPRDPKLEPLSPRTKVKSPRTERWQKYSGDRYRSKSPELTRNGARERYQERERGKLGPERRSRGSEPEAQRPGSRGRSRTPLRSPHSREGSLDRRSSQRSLSRDRGYERYRHRAGSPPRTRPPRTSPRSRERSRDRSSLHSGSGSVRRLVSPGSPRRRSSLSPSPRARRDRSLSQRSSSTRADTPPVRNGKFSPPPAKDVSAINEDILDNVSDISEGDILDVESEPVVAGNVEPQNNVEEDLLCNLRTSLGRVDVEEISDEEAEWSDDVETGGLSDLEIEFGDDWEDPIKYFEVTDAELSHMKALYAPNESVYDRVKSGKLSPVPTDVNFTEILKCCISTEYDEKFIENLETITKFLQSELPNHENNLVREQLVQVALNSVNYNNAMSQARPPGKVRQLKVGLKLVQEMLLCGEQLRDAVLKGGIQSELTSLFRREYMAMSIKLIIIKTLDFTLNFPLGILLFSQLGLYTSWLQASADKQSTRTQFSFNSLLTKLHLGELLQKLVNLLGERDDETIGDNIEDISAILDSIGEIYNDIDMKMSQPIRFLPSHSHFDLSQKNFGSPETGYFYLMSSFGVVDILVSLLNSASSAEEEAVVSGVQNLLSAWAARESGLLFLASQPAETNGLLRVLLVGLVMEPETMQDEEVGEEEEDEGRDLGLDDEGKFECGGFQCIVKVNIAIEWCCRPPHPLGAGPGAGAPSDGSAVSRHCAARGHQGRGCAERHGDAGGADCHQRPVQPKLHRAGPGSAGHRPHHGPPHRLPPGSHQAQLGGWQEGHEKERDPGLRQRAAAAYSPRLGQRDLAAALLRPAAPARPLGLPQQVGRAGELVRAPGRPRRLYRGGVGRAAGHGAAQRGRGQGERQPGQ